MTTLAELRAKPHTSVSQIKTFIQCPRKYDFQYVSKISPAFRPLALVLGTAWHATIGCYLLGAEKIQQEELREVLADEITRGVEEEDVPVLFEEEEQSLGAVIDAATKMLDVFLAKVALPKRVLGVEVPFAIDLVDELTGEVLPLPLVGALDAVVEEESEKKLEEEPPTQQREREIQHLAPVIWELKTGKKKWSQDQLDFDLQPTAYVTAARALGHANPSVKLLVTTKGKKPDVQVERLARHWRDERELVEVAFSVHRAIRAGVDHPIRGWQCATCPFAHACEP